MLETLTSLEGCLDRLEGVEHHNLEAGFGLFSGGRTLKTAIYYNKYTKKYTLMHDGDENIFDSMPLALSALIRVYAVESKSLPVARGYSNYE